jgi:hypothetical protein
VEEDIIWVLGMIELENEVDVFMGEALLLSLLFSLLLLLM